MTCTFLLRFQMQPIQMKDQDPMLQNLMSLIDGFHNMANLLRNHEDRAQVNVLHNKQVRIASEYLRLKRHGIFEPGVDTYLEPWMPDVNER